MSKKYHTLVSALEEHIMTEAMDAWRDQAVADRWRLVADASRQAFGDKNRDVFGLSDFRALILQDVAQAVLASEFYDWSVAQLAGQAPTIMIETTPPSLEERPMFRTLRG